MAAVKASRRTPVASASGEFSKNSAKEMSERKTVLMEANGTRETEEALPEEVLQPVPTGDLRLALTRKSPSLPFLQDVRMERLVDKLMLLNYAAVVPRGIGSSGLSKNFFLDERPDQAVGRFHVFASLAVWMIGKLGVDLKEPTERDDPNITVQSISDGLRTLGMQTEIVPHRLKIAKGPDVIAILYELACMCLKKQTEVSAPDFKSNIAVEEITEEEPDNEVDVEYDQIPLFNWEQEEVADDLNDNDESIDRLQANSDIAEKQRAAEEWRLEADRMGPLFGRQDGVLGDRMGWSERVKKLDACRKELQQSVEMVGEKLAGISSEISRSTEKIHNREKYISVNHRDKVERFRTASGKYHAAKARYEAHNSEVETYARALAELTAEFEKLKRRVEEKGSNMGEKATMTAMKSAMKRMKEEIGVYNIKCAIAEIRLQELTEAMQNADVAEKFSDNMDTVGVLPAVRQ
ncbi:putative Intraflagellar transport protein 57-like protein [Hypsibius exemplaris]|uniref:Intraflagellar transport protein 57-like protein n=1 Tax=Hypsibius exemplaris TaxID=2072580 RepID=A0A1W0WRX1_HYPEX|nr:putative Intraflagellar transport protein 57-like protein [Hypsibius exemplaris]